MAAGDKNLWDWIARNTGEYLSGQEGWIPGRDTAGKIKQEMSGGDANWIPEVSVAGGDRSPKQSVFGIGTDPTYNPGGGGGTLDKPTEVVDTPTTQLQIDPAYAAFMQKQAEDTAEARKLRESILGRRGEVQSILDAILGNIDTELGEAKGRRTGQFDRDVDSLVGALDAAIPDIQNAFAAMGLSNSTYKGDRVQDTRDSYGKSYEDTNRQLNEDLTGFQRNAASKKAQANTNAKKMFSALDEVEGMQANADNLGQLKKFSSDTSNALTDFEGEKSKFMPGGEALRAISALDNGYDFSKTLDTFNTFASEKASPAGNGVGGGKAKTGQIYEDDKKKNKTEVQINNPVGAASA